MNLYTPTRGLLVAAALVAALGVSTSASAQVYDSGSDGSDGSLNPATDVTIPLPPDGVLRYTTIDIPVGVTVQFARNAENTRAVLLASGDVNIDGIIDVSGRAPLAAVNPYPGVYKEGGAGGPGGFNGGPSDSSLTRGSDGSGPGGGGQESGTGQVGPGGGASPVTDGTTGRANSGAAGMAWGNADWLLLGGGSGGGAGRGVEGGGGGGGALTLATSGTLNLSGQILARGASGTNNGNNGGGGGGGGVVHLIGTTVNFTSGALVDASGASGGGNWSGTGGAGLVKVEAYFRAGPISASCVPLPRISSNPPAATPWSGNARPRLFIETVDGQTPTGVVGTLPPDLSAPWATDIIVIVRAEYIPLGTDIELRLYRMGGTAIAYQSTLNNGDLSSSTATFIVNIPSGSRVNRLQAHVLEFPIP